MSKNTREKDRTTIRDKGKFGPRQGNKNWEETRAFTEELMRSEKGLHIPPAAMSNIVTNGVYRIDNQGIFNYDRTVFYNIQLQQGTETVTATHVEQKAYDQGIITPQQVAYRIHQGVVHKTPHTTMYADYKEKGMRRIKGKPQDSKREGSSKEKQTTTWQSPPFANWSFEIGSFMVLLGDQEEVNYRLMRRSLLECWSAAPVAGLYSYLRCLSGIVYERSPSNYYYLSPFGCKTASLRNMRLKRTIDRLNLLDDGHVSVYTVKPSSRAKNHALVLARRTPLAWIITTWLLLAAILFGITFLLRSQRTSWIGLSSCILLVSWSIVLRPVERSCLQPMPLGQSLSNKPDAAIFLGRRHSCFVIEGRRQQVLAWTGTGLSRKEGTKYRWLDALSHVATTALLIFIFMVVPNGTTMDQIAFIVLNILGQLNVVVGQHLNSAVCLASLDEVVSTDSPTRTHVYAFLIQRFGDGSWVESTQLLPQTGVWTRWKELAKNTKYDPKKIYDLLAGQMNSPVKVA